MTAKELFSQEVIIRMEADPPSDEEVGKIISSFREEREQTRSKGPGFVVEEFTNQGEEDWELARGIATIRKMRAERARRVEVPQIVSIR